jgi:hypothetical protein
MRDKWTQQLSTMHSHENELQGLLANINEHLDTPMEQAFLGPESGMSNMQLLMSQENNAHNELYGLSSDYVFTPLQSDNNTLMQICAWDPEEAGSVVSGQINVRRVVNVHSILQTRKGNDDLDVTQPFCTFALRKGKECFAELWKAYEKEGGIKDCIEAVNTAFDENYAFTVEQAAVKHHSFSFTPNETGTDTVQSVYTKQGNFKAEKHAFNVSVQSCNVTWNKNCTDTVFIAEALHITMKQGADVVKQACIVMSNYNCKGDTIPKTAAFLFGLPHNIVAGSPENLLQDAASGPNDVSASLLHQYDNMTPTATSITTNNTPLQSSSSAAIRKFLQLSVESRTVLQCTACMKALFSTAMQQTEQKLLNESTKMWIDNTQGTAVMHTEPRFDISHIMIMPGLRVVNFRMHTNEQPTNLLMLLTAVEDCKDYVSIVTPSSLGTSGPESSLGTRGPESSLGTSGPESSLGTSGPESSLGTSGPESSLDISGPVAKRQATGSVTVKQPVPQTAASRITLQHPKAQIEKSISRQNKICNTIENRNTRISLRQGNVEAESMAETRSQPTLCKLVYRPIFNNGNISSKYFMNNI